MNRLILNQIMHPKKARLGGYRIKKTNDSQAESRQNGERDNRCYQGERQGRQLLLAGPLQPLMLN